VETLADYMTGADLLGRLHVLSEAKMLPREIRDRQGLRKALTEKLVTAPGFAELTPESVSPSGALNWLRSLTSFTRVAYDKLRPQYREAAFTIAKVEEVRLLDAAKDSLDRALATGSTEREFIRDLNAAFDKAGVTRLASHHAQTVFQTNIQTAYANGRFQQLVDPDVVKALPYWQYVTAGDDRVRPAHAAMDQFIARWDDDIWHEWYPPNGYNCRCTVVALGRDEAHELDPNADLAAGGRIPAIEGAPAAPDQGFAQLPQHLLAMLARGMGV
jgi:SPP1 gp7 family putative phage head morphogenesis protein